MVEVDRREVGRRHAEFSSATSFTAPHSAAAVVLGRWWDLAVISTRPDNDSRRVGRRSQTHHLPHDVALVGLDPPTHPTPYRGSTTTNGMAGRRPSGGALTRLACWPVCSCPARRQRLDDEVCPSIPAFTFLRRFAAQLSFPAAAGLILDGDAVGRLGPARCGARRRRCPGHAHFQLGRAAAGIRIGDCRPSSTVDLPRIQHGGLELLRGHQVAVRQRPAIMSSHGTRCDDPGRPPIVAVPPDAG